MGGPSVKRKLPFVCISAPVFKTYTWNLLSIPVLCFCRRGRGWREAYFEGRGLPADLGPLFLKPPGQAVLPPEFATWVSARALNMGLEGRHTPLFPTFLPESPNPGHQLRKFSLSAQHIRPVPPPRDLWGPPPTPQIWGARSHCPKWQAPEESRI